MAISSGYPPLLKALSVRAEINSSGLGWGSCLAHRSDREQNNHPYKDMQARAAWLEGTKLKTGPP